MALPGYPPEAPGGRSTRAQGWGRLGPGSPALFSFSCLTSGYGDDQRRPSPLPVPRGDDRVAPGDQLGDPGSREAVAGVGLRSSGRPVLRPAIWGRLVDSERRIAEGCGETGLVGRAWVRGGVGGTSAT